MLVHINRALEVLAQFAELYAYPAHDWSLVGYNNRDVRVCDAAHGDSLKGVNMAGFDFGDGVRKIFLAGVGAVATGAEKSQQIIEDLVKKGELTVEQGKTLNEELSRKASKAAYDTEDNILRARMENMSAEERSAYAQRVADIAADINEKATTVEAEVEVVADEDEAASEAVEPEAADE